MIWLKNCQVGVKQQSFTHSLEWAHNCCGFKAVSYWISTLLVWYLDTRQRWSISLTRTILL